MKISVFIATVLLTVVATYAGYKFGQYKHAQKVVPVEHVRIDLKDVLGTVRPEFELPDLQGQQRSITEWDDNILVINFWATWCPPCLDEIPVFIEMQKKYADQGLQFIGIALQDPEEIHEFYLEMGMNYPVLTGQREVIEVARAYGNYTGGLPYTVFINQAHRITFIKQGPINREETEKNIINLL